MKIEHFLSFLLLLSVIPGCERMDWPKGTAKAEKLWQEKGSENYSYLYHRACYCFNPWEHSIRVVVRNDTVADAYDPYTGLTLMDTIRQMPLYQVDPSPFKTINEFFEIVKEKGDVSGKKFDVSFEPKLGYPVLIRINEDPASDVFLHHIITDLQLE
jgi:hypothetical protein